MENETGKPSRKRRGCSGAKLTTMGREGTGAKKKVEKKTGNRRVRPSPVERGCVNQGSTQKKKTTEYEGGGTSHAVPRAKK